MTVHIVFHQTLLNWWKKSLYWLHLILWFGCSGSKAKGISGLCAEVNGLITNWASGEKWAVDILVIRMSLFCSIYLHLSPQHEDEILNFATHVSVWVMGTVWLLELHRKKKLPSMVFSFCGDRPAMESKVDRSVSPKDPRSWVGLVTKPWFC